jgi:hypothetical protein
VGQRVKLKIKKKSDSDALVTFVRDDGTATSGRLGSGGFGAVHDLTHYVVETSLRLRSGFFGLLAQGWNIPDFEAKGADARLPDEAVVAECVVGQLSNVVFAGQPVSADDFNWLVTQAVTGVRPGAAAPSISAETFAHMQQQLSDLLVQWRALPLGNALELEFVLR